jgi:hypothetical protein
LAKSNLARIFSPPLGGVVKVSPIILFGMAFARAYPYFGGVLGLYDCSVYDCSPLYIGGYPLPTLGGYIPHPPIGGVFLFSLQWGVDPPKRGGAIRN